MQAVTLEQLTALNREISALAAAGVPLTAGLVRVADEFSGPTSALASRLAQRMEQGQDLSSAINAEGDALPPAYRTVIEAGLKSGRLTAALEGYTTTATRIAELRRVVGLAAVYPVMLLIAIWCLFLFLNNYVLPKFDELVINDRMWVERVRYPVFSLGGGGRLLVWCLVPALIVLVAWLWWRRSASATEASAAGQTSWLSWIPGVARVRRLSCEANFADLLRLFIEQRIPLNEALPLAAEGSGLKAISAETNNLVTYVEAGHPLGTSTPAFQNLPPLVRLAFASSRGSESLIHGLQHAVDTYHQRARSWAHSVSFYVPVGATALIGGMSVAVYALLLLQPYVTLLIEIDKW